MPEYNPKEWERERLKSSDLNNIEEGINNNASNTIQYDAWPPDHEEVSTVDEKNSIYIDVSNNNIYHYDGANWVQLTFSNDSLDNDRLTVAGNEIELGGSSDISYRNDLIETQHDLGSSVYHGESNLEDLNSIITDADLAENPHNNDQHINNYLRDDETHNNNQHDPDFAEDPHGNESHSSSALGLEVLDEDSINIEAEDREKIYLHSLSGYEIGDMVTVFIAVRPYFIDIDEYDTASNVRFTYGVDGSGDNEEPYVEIRNDDEHDTAKVDYQIVKIG